MSRYDYSDPGCDQAYCDALSDPPPNQICADCHEEFFTVFFATTTPTWCDACWTTRDAHTSALEESYLLKRMAKAFLSADLTKVKEVA